MGVGFCGVVAVPIVGYRHSDRDSISIASNWNSDHDGDSVSMPGHL